ncbi:unnamed protein product, partial [marine sediment metagenome]
YVTVLYDKGANTLRYLFLINSNLNLYPGYRGINRWFRYCDQDR